MLDHYDYNIVDCCSIQLTTQKLATLADVPTIRVDFAKLSQAMATHRSCQKWSNGTNIAIIQRNHDHVDRFCQALSKLNYRTSCVNTQDNKHGLVPEIAYLLGTFASRRPSSLVLMTNEPRLLSILIELKTRQPEAKIAIAYWRSLIDFRLSMFGLPNVTDLVDFIDLDSFDGLFSGLPEIKPVESKTIASLF